MPKYVQVVTADGKCAKHGVALERFRGAGVMADDWFDCGECYTESGDREKHMEEVVRKMKQFLDEFEDELGVLRGR